ncbi:MAG: single-stranded-DNA-specific exonuclease RecJ [Bryobacteraceae bacterium]
MSERPPARWTLPTVTEEDASRLAGELGISALVARILIKRGYGDAEAAHRFLHPSLDAMHDPRLLAGMEAAAPRLARAVREKEPILLYGDYDVDGTSSVVILKKSLELLGADADFHVPHRLKDGYGMRPEVITEAAARGVKLIVSVDTGIRALEVCRHARELGVDVIVTDHHLPEAELPPAAAVVNPNQPGCPYPEKNLCGAGVAFKLVQALWGELDVPAARAARLTESFLKLVAIATVADVVPLTGENRIIVSHGLRGLGRTPNPGLRALLAVAGFEEGANPTAGQIAFRVAPRINAAGRMATARAVIELLTTTDAGRAAAIAAELNELNADRQAAEAGMLEDALAACEAEPVGEDRRGLVFAGEGWHRGVVGIVASRLVDRFHRPAFVIGIDSERGEAQGSGRSIPAFHLLEGLESMADLFLKFGGHRQAAGVTLRTDRLEEFRKRFNEYACRVLEPADLCAQYEPDAVLRLGELNEKTFGEIAALAPFGYANPAPLFAVLGAEVPAPPTVMKEKHLRFRIRQQGRWFGCKAWHWAERLEAVTSARDFLLSVEDDTYAGGWVANLRDVRS